MTSQISTLQPGKNDSYKYPKLLYEAQQNPVPIASMTVAHDYTDNTIDKMPLNHLLFLTGYFSIKKQINEENLEIGWTNSETKNAFYSVYNLRLDLKRDFLLDIFDKLKIHETNEKEQKELIILFLSHLENKFIMMLEKYYSPEKADHEHNAIFRLFFDIQVI